MPAEREVTLMMISLPRLKWVEKIILPVASTIFHSGNWVARPRRISWVFGLGVTMIERFILGECVPTFKGYGI